MGWTILLPGGRYLTYPLLKNCVLHLDGHESIVIFMSLMIRNIIVSIFTSAVPELPEGSIYVLSTYAIPGPSTVVEMLQFLVRCDVN